MIKASLKLPHEKIAPASKQLVVGTVIVAGYYLLLLFAGFLAPYDYREQIRREPSAPPTILRFRDEFGSTHFHPFIYANRLEDPLTLRYSEDTSHAFPISFLVRGNSYRFLGLFQTDIHLFGVQDPASTGAPRLRLLGADALGRDRFSRLLQAIRFSLIVSPIATLLACGFGILIGLISGYAGRLVDTALMAIADAMIALPTLIVILAARAAFPLELPPLTAAVLLVLILVFTGWAEIARLTRGLVQELRYREFVLAARASGLAEMRILFRHILPNISRKLFAQASLMLPLFLLAEVALSFLGVGLQEPEPSLGNMLTAASDISQLSAHPFLLLAPAVVIFVFTVGIRLVGDGLNQGPRQPG